MSPQTNRDAHTLDLGQQQNSFELTGHGQNRGSLCSEVTVAYRGEFGNRPSFGDRGKDELGACLHQRLINATINPLQRFIDRHSRRIEILPSDHKRAALIESRPTASSDRGAIAESGARSKDKTQKNTKTYADLHRNCKPESKSKDQKGDIKPISTSNPQRTDIANSEAGSRSKTRH